MGTRGSYGIAHNDNLLVTYGDIDMYPSEWGFHLAKEAFDNRHRAQEIGEASLEVRYCQWTEENIYEYKEWGELLSGPSPSKKVYQNERYHFCFHRPGTTQAEVNLKNLWRTVRAYPSFIEMVNMEEVYPEVQGAWDREYHYTWVTSPHNLFVASTEWPESARWEEGGRTAIWDMEHQDHIDDLAEILLDGNTFQTAVKQRVATYIPRLPDNWR